MDFYVSFFYAELLANIKNYLLVILNIYLITFFFLITSMLSHVNFHGWRGGKQTITLRTHGSFHFTQMGDCMILEWALGGKRFITTLFITFIGFVTGMRSFVPFKIGVLFKYFPTGMAHLWLWMLYLLFKNNNYYNI